LGSSFATTDLSCAVPAIKEAQSADDHISSDATATRDDLFDALADDMVDMGVVADEPKPLSTIDRWVQQICSPIIMKYVVLKGYMREWGYWMISKVSNK
jgi:hypothetical protein